MIWIAIDRNIRRSIGFVIGDRGTRTGKRLWEEIKDIIVGKVNTVYWAPYKSIIPSSIHVQSKKETYPVGNYNGLLRHYLARLKRRTKCYTKSIEMLQISIALFIAKYNNYI